MLRLYREAIALRNRIPSLSSSHFRWLPTEPGVLAFTRGDGFACVVNCLSRPVCTPVEGRLLLASIPDVGEKLPPNVAAWFLLDHKPGQESSRTTHEAATAHPLGSESAGRP